LCCYRLDGKKKKEEGVNGEATSAQAENQQKPNFVRGIPDYDYQPGTIKFIRFAKPQQEKEVTSFFDQGCSRSKFYFIQEVLPDNFKNFSGTGRSLREAKSRK
jgi:hypothetical protein